MKKVVVLLSYITKHAVLQQQHPSATSFKEKTSHKSKHEKTTAEAKQKDSQPDIFGKRERCIRVF
jgi:hypothetical protein